MMDPRWVAGFLSGTHYHEIFCPFSPVWITAKPELPVDFCQHPFLVLHIISQHWPIPPPPKQENLTTLSRALPHSKEWSHLLQTSVPYCLVYHIVLPVGTHSSLLASNAAPHPRHTHSLFLSLTHTHTHRCLETIHTRMETLPRVCYQLEFFILTGPIAFFIVLLHSDFSPGC